NVAVAPLSIRLRRTRAWLYLLFVHPDVGHLAVSDEQGHGHTFELVMPQLKVAVVVGEPRLYVVATSPDADDFILRHVEPHIVKLRAQLRGRYDRIIVRPLRGVRLNCFVPSLRRCSLRRSTGRTRGRL